MGLAYATEFFIAGIAAFPTSAPFLCKGLSGRMRGRIGSW